MKILLMLVSFLIVKLTAGTAAGNPKTLHENHDVDEPSGYKNEEEAGGYALPERTEDVPEDDFLDDAYDVEDEVPQQSPGKRRINPWPKHCWGPSPTQCM